MKNAFMVISLIFLLCLIVGCQQGEKAAGESNADVEADIQAIKDIVADINAAVSAADIDTIMSIYADDAVRIPPKEPAAIGKEAIQRDAQKMFEEMSPQEKDVVKDVQVSGNLAVAHIAWSALITPKAGGEPFDANGNWILVFKRESGEAWKVIYSIWNDETLVHPDQVE